MIHENFRDPTWKNFVGLQISFDYSKQNQKYFKISKTVFQKMPVAGEYAQPIDTNFCYSTSKRFLYDVSNFTTKRPRGIRNKALIL